MLVNKYNIDLPINVSIRTWYELNHFAQSDEQFPEEVNSEDADSAGPDMISNNISQTEKLNKNDEN